MQSIVLIIPYFGPFKGYLDFWLKSVEKNPTINFLLITDQKNIVVPSNVEVIFMEFTSCKELIQSKFDFEILNLHPYKLCDFKPAYGYIFQEYIRDFDFWGHCDNDLIFGDIRYFIADEILEKYDRILSRGHFTLYRNNMEVNESFMKAVPSYRSVFTSDLVFHFDEHPGTGGYWFKNLPDRIYEKIIFDDLNWKKYKFIDVHKFNTLDRNRKYFIYLFEDGKLYRCFWDGRKVDREEIMYVHFQKRFMKVNTLVSNYFTIIPNRFVAYNSNLGYQYLKDSNKGGFLYAFYHFVRIKFNSLKLKINLWKHKK